MNSLKPNKPLFITFEGGEGAGKTTLVAKLTQALQKQGYEVVTTREPGGSLLGDTIRSLLLQHDSEMQIGSRAELLLFLAARAQHVQEVIKPALDAGKVVLCDRFSDSSVAYQGMARGLGMQIVQDLCLFASHEIEPTYTLYLDIDPKIGLTRATRRTGEADRMESEKLEFHQKVRNAFHEIGKQNPQRFRILDASQPAHTVFHQAMDILTPVLA